MPEVLSRYTSLANSLSSRWDDLQAYSTNPNRTVLTRARSHFSSATRYALTILPIAFAVLAQQART